MELFKNIVKASLLNELRQNREDDIKKAINNVLRVRISYNDKKGGKGKNERYILPVAFGLTKSGKKAVRAYQTAGSSKRGLTNPPNNRKVPKWKLFLLDNIYSWANGNRSFKDYKDQLISLGLNTHGDKGMTELYAITPFADADVQVAKSTMPIGPKPITKMDVEPSAKSQQKDTTDKDNFVPAEKTRQNVIDINPKTDYSTDRLQAPDTKPITKQDISAEPEAEPENGQADNQTQMMTAKTSPVTKDEVESGENQEDVMNKFKDITDRMDNLYNDEEEDEEENAGK